MRNFIVLYVLDGFEFAVADQINSEKRAVAFSPSLRTYSHRSRHTKKLVYDIKPIFEGYVFVQFPTDEINFRYLKEKVKGVLDVLFTGDHLSEVRPKHMLQLIEDELRRERLAKPSATVYEDPIYKKLKVVVESGSMKGLEGEVMGYDPRKNSLAVRAKFFGVERRVMIDAALIPDFSADILEAIQK